MVIPDAPVIEVPGLTPKSPKRVVGPVLVTAEPPRTAKLAAEPKVPFPAGQASLGGATLKVVLPVLPLKPALPL